MFHADWAHFNEDMTENGHFLTKTLPGETLAAAEDTEGHHQGHVRYYNHADQSNINGDMAEKVNFGHKMPPGDKL